MSRERDIENMRTIVRCDHCREVIPLACLIHAINIKFDFLNFEIRKEVCSNCQIEIMGYLDKMEGVFEVDRHGANYTIRAYPPVGVEGERT